MCGGSGKKMKEGNKEKKIKGTCVCGGEKKRKKKNEKKKEI